MIYYEDIGPWLGRQDGSVFRYAKGDLVATKNVGGYIVADLVTGRRWTYGTKEAADKALKDIYPPRPKEKAMPPVPKPHYYVIRDASQVVGSFGDRIAAATYATQCARALPGTTYTVSEVRATAKFEEPPKPALIGGLVWR